MFFLFYDFWRCLFFLLFDSKDYRVLCNMGYRKGASFLLFFRITLFFKILLLPIISLRFLFFLCAIIGLSWKVFLRVGLICNKCQRLSMVSLMFGRVLLNFSSSGILVFFFFFFAIFGFEVNKASLVTSDILLNWLVIKFSL